MSAMFLFLVGDGNRYGGVLKRVNHLGSRTMAVAELKVSCGIGVGIRKQKEVERKGARIGNRRKK